MQIPLSDAAHRLNLSRARTYVLAARGDFGPVARADGKHATVSADAVLTWGTANLQRRLQQLKRNQELRMAVGHLRMPASGAPDHE